MFLGVSSIVVYAPKHWQQAASGTTVLFIAISCNGGGDDGGDDGGVPANTAPTADDISIRTNLTSPFIRAQLSGSDANNDTLIYVLDAPIEGAGYDCSPSSLMKFTQLSRDFV